MKYFLLALILVSCGGDKENDKMFINDNEQPDSVKIGGIVFVRDSSRSCAHIETVFVHDTVVRIIPALAHDWTSGELLYCRPQCDSIYEVLVEVCDTTVDYYGKIVEENSGEVIWLRPEYDSLIINCHWDTVKVKPLNR